jgi:hypothetical protein
MACPVARPIEWPCPGRSTCIIGMAAVTRARTVSQFSCLFPPRLEPSGWQSKGVIRELFRNVSGLNTASGVPPSAGTGGRVRPGGHISYPSSLYQPHQRRGRGDKKGGDT